MKQNIWEVDHRNMTVAFSKHGAQILLTCQLCESSSEKNWKCTVCDLFMSEICTLKNTSEIQIGRHV